MSFSLCIDQGNSRTKIGVFEQDNLIESQTFDYFSFEDIGALFHKYRDLSTIFSTVVKPDEKVIAYLKEKSLSFIELTHETKVPINNQYKTPETLGKDRLAGVVGASFLKPHTDILVVDIGSAITFDFIDSTGVYRGGNISPGIGIRLRGLHEFTQKLPLVEAKQTNELLGSDTQSAILSGVMYGIVFEIDGYIDELRKEHPLLSTFLTGGSTFYFVNKLKNAIFANENLILTGLNRILLYNAQK
ncbi:type III pantothenate kinase [Paludibacter sp. 221]|uniref:type III pantothenate kinase n=1 Tax=Paludibacter sp. 221 TaxID=2302939 RepID=UPI0013D89C4F|nr:type III pantothenate kinase [Paludibacter sp. 221]NDV47652.1 type III pantothenate kinase [Paludibacter sp. 221]